MYGRNYLTPREDELQNEVADLRERVSAFEREHDAADAVIHLLMHTVPIDTFSEGPIATWREAWAEAELAR